MYATAHSKYNKYVESSDRAKGQGMRCPRKWQRLLRIWSAGGRSPGPGRSVTHHTINITARKISETVKRLILEYSVSQEF